MARGGESDVSSAGSLPQRLVAGVESSLSPADIDFDRNTSWDWLRALGRPLSGPSAAEFVAADREFSQQHSALPPNVFERQYSGPMLQLGGVFGPHTIEIQRPSGSQPQLSDASFQRMPATMPSPRVASIDYCRHASYAGSAGFQDYDQLSPRSLQRVVATEFTPCSSFLTAVSSPRRMATSASLGAAPTCHSPRATGGPIPQAPHEPWPAALAHLPRDVSDGWLPGTPVRMESAMTVTSARTPPTPPSFQRLPASGSPRFSPSHAILELQRAASGPPGVSESPSIYRMVNNPLRLL